MRVTAEQRVLPSFTACLLLVCLTNATFAEDKLSASGYRLVFDNLPSPFTGEIDYLASHLITPDGARVTGAIQKTLYGAPHWFKWEGHPSWPYDALRQWTGGAGCCMWYWFVSKAPPYRVLPVFDGGTSDIELIDPDNDGVMEFETREDSYSFSTDTVYRTIPRLRWRVTENGPEVAKDLMIEWHLSEAELAPIATQIEASVDNGHIGEWMKTLTTTVITQYYASGDLDVAKAAYDVLYPDSLKDKEDLWTRIVLQIACGQYGIEEVECSSD